MPSRSDSPELARTAHWAVRLVRNSGCGKKGGAVHHTDIGLPLRRRILLLCTCCGLHHGAQQRRARGKVCTAGYPLRAGARLDDRFHATRNARSCCKAPCRGMHCRGNGACGSAGGLRFLRVDTVLLSRSGRYSRGKQLRI